MTCTKILNTPLTANADGLVHAVVIHCHHNLDESSHPPDILAYASLHHTLLLAIFGVLQLIRHIPFETEQVVLLHHALLHHIIKRILLLCDLVPMLVSISPELRKERCANNASRPANTYWEIFKYIGKAKCLNIKAIYYFHSGQNTLSDFLIFLWPAKDLLNVQVSLRQRITLTCMFSLGVM
jgi:hypothetical protein